MIRKYKEADLAALLQVYRNASTLAHPFLSTDFIEKVCEDIPKLYLPNTETWVMEKDQQLVGFISLMGAEVAALFLDPAWHGQGLGRALMDKAVQEKGDLEVVVFTKNKIGRPFYERYGFREKEHFLMEETGLPCIRMVYQRN